MLIAEPADIALEAVSNFDKAVAIMTAALQENEEAHTLKDAGQDSTAKFTEKNKLLIQLYLDYGGTEHVKIVIQGNQVLFIVVGSGLKCHSKKLGLHEVIKNSGRPPRIRRAMYLDFHIKPTADEETTHKEQRRSPQRVFQPVPTLS